MTDQADKANQPRKPIAGFVAQEGRPKRFDHIVEQVSARDRLWFQRHPEHDLYVRPYVPGEFWPKRAEQDTVVLVTNYRDPIHVGSLLREHRAVTLLGRASGRRITILDEDTREVITRDTPIEGLG